VDGLLVDQVAHDVRRMLAVNTFFVEDHARGPSPAARAYRQAHGRAPYRRIGYALVAPERRGQLGELAEEIFSERYGGLRALRSPDFALIARIIGGVGTRARGDLLSFLLFDEVYVDALIDAGREDAGRWLSAHPTVWSSDPSEGGFATTVSAPDSEAVALDEFRAMRRG
jgi:NTE family protein